MLYRLLERLVTTVESLVRGDSRELQAAEREAATARAAADAGRERLAVVAELRRLQERVRRAGDGDGDDRDARISEALDQLVQALLAGPPPEPDLPAAAVQPAGPGPGER
jgi:hypothetical protein